MTSMTSLLTARLVIAATLVDGFLGGLNINRALVEMPAWQQTGPVAWAQFSKHADLAPTAMVLYPLSAFAGALLSIAAVISFHRDWSGRRGRRGRTGLRSASVPVYAAALLTVGGLLLTIQAAPIMLSVPDLGDDATALQRALDGFQSWGNIRGMFQVLAFIANMWSLVVLLTLSSQSEAR